MAGKEGSGGVSAAFHLSAASGSGEGDDDDMTDEARPLRVPGVFRCLKGACGRGAGPLGEAG